MKKYISILIIVLVIGAVGSSIYQQITKKSAKSVRLACHKNSTVFEKIINPNLLEKLQKDIKDGKISVTTEIDKAKYMNSQLFLYVDKNKIKNDFETLIGALSQNLDSSVTILIYENDKKDPGKKTAKSKLYAGYLVFSYKVDKTLVYKLQIDFFDEKGKDIQKVLACGLKSVLTIKNKE